MAPPSKKDSKKGKKTRGGHNIGALAQVAANQIMTTFLSLSVFSQRELLLRLVGMFNSLAEERLRIPIGDEATRSTKTTKPTPPLTALVPATPAKGKLPKSNSTTGVAKKVPAWDRPVVRDLPVAARMRNRDREERNTTPEGIRDQGLISAIISAIVRARTLKLEDEVIRLAIEPLAENRDALGLLWKKPPPASTTTLPCSLQAAGASPKGAGSTESITPVPQDPRDPVSPPKEVDEEDSKMPSAPTASQNVDSKTPGGRKLSKTERKILKAQPKQCIKDFGRKTYITPFVVEPEDIIGDSLFHSGALSRIEPKKVAELLRTSAPPQPKGMGLQDMAERFIDNDEDLSFENLVPYVKVRKTDLHVVLARVPRPWGSDSSENTNAPSTGNDPAAESTVVTTCDEEATPRLENPYATAGERLSSPRPERQGGETRGRSDDSPARSQPSPKKKKRKTSKSAEKREKH